MGGSKYCDKIITMGTPYHGSSWSWLGLFTPIGFVFRDLWQMRPGSSFLKSLHNSPVPKGLTIYNFYSKRDIVAKGDSAIFSLSMSPRQVVPVPMHETTHFVSIQKACRRENSHYFRISYKDKMKNN